jgi:S1-C subfamily serine protease
MQPGVPHVLLNPQSIRLWNATGTLENCVRGTGYTYAKYSKATPALIVEKDDVEHIGTAAVIRFGTPKRNKYYLVTNRHVVDAAQGVKLKRVEFLENAILECPTKWNFCSTDDIAAVQIDEGASAEFFCLCHDAHLLDKVVTFGYPKIPFADRNYLAVHSGEINAVFGTTSKEEMFLISNQVAPGSSGGPVVDEKGFLAGLTAKAFQGKMEPDADFLISWNAAVTFKRIRAFLAGISGLEDWISGADEFLELRSDT